MHPLIVLLVLILIACASPPATKTNDIQSAFDSGLHSIGVEIDNPTRAQSIALRKAGMSIWARSNNKLRGTIGKDAWGKIKAFGLQATLLSDNRGLKFYDARYHTYKQVITTLTGLATESPTIARTLELGASTEGRTILALRIGRGDQASASTIAFTSGIHAREVVTPELTLRTAGWLLSNYGKDDLATQAVDKEDIWIVPMINPDGHVRVERGLDWRKNVDGSLGGGGLPPFGIGVDLNRNFETRSWCTIGVDKDPAGENYCGPHPFSEPETRAMRQMYETRDFGYMLSWHAYGNLVIWPWNDTTDPPPDDILTTIGKQLGAASGYQAEQGSKFYEDSGEEIDYAYSRFGIRAFLAEVGDDNDSFDPEFSRVDSIWEHNKPLVQTLLRQALPATPSAN